MAEWQTRRTQNPLSERACGFKSHPGHHYFLRTSEDYRPGMDPQQPQVRRVAPVGLLGRVGPTSFRERVLARWMAESNDGWLEVRTSLLRWALRSDPVEVPNLLGPRKVAGPVAWSLWDTGVESAPPLVQRCLRSQAEFGSQVVLTEGSVADYVVVPDWVMAQRDRMATVHFSDILRLILLAAHGGTWMDATVLLTGPAPAQVAAAPFFAFTRPSDPFLLSSWYLKAEQGNPLVDAWLELAHPAESTFRKKRAA